MTYAFARSLFQEKSMVRRARLAFETIDYDRFLCFDGNPLEAPEEHPDTCGCPECDPPIVSAEQEAAYPDERRYP